MEIDAVLEAFKDFEKKGKKDTCPLLEQFLCHVAKTGEAVIPWSQFKPYFLFKLEKVMDDFHAATPEQRGPTNPNVEYIPFDEMKKRILKIVDGYNGIPFTIQRLCELLTEPKRNYSGAEKFLRGVEKNVMVVSCVYPTSGRNINGPGTPRAFHRPKLALTTSLSTNGLPDCTVSREPEASTEQMEEQHDGDSSLSKRESRQCSGMKNKLEEEDEDSEAVEHDVKRLKFGDNEEESEEKGTTCPAESESAEETPDSSKDAEEEEKIDTSVEEPVISEDHEPRSAEPEPSEMDEQSPEADPVASPTHREASDSTTDQPEQAVQPGEGLSSESQDNGESADRVSSSSSGSNDSDAEDTPTDTPGDTSVPTTPTSTPEQSAEDATDENSDSTLTANEPGEPE